MIKDENLCEFDKNAIAYLIELGAKYIGNKNKLTTRFSYIADLAREANFWAVDDGFNVVSAAHLQKAFNSAKERHGLLETKITEMYKQDMYLIDAAGERIGQINGLAVYGGDFYAFGRIGNNDGFSGRCQQAVQDFSPGHHIDAVGAVKFKMPFIGGWKEDYILFFIGIARFPVKGFQVIIKVGSRFFFRKDKKLKTVHLPEYS